MTAAAVLRRLDARWSSAHHSVIVRALRGVHVLRPRALANVSVCAHDAGMDTTAQTPLTTEHAMALQMAAAERLEQAETELRIAGIRITAYGTSTPMRLKIGAAESYRRAAADLEAAQAAYEAAQDLDCPEE